MTTIGAASGALVWLNFASLIQVLLLAVAMRAVLRRVVMPAEAGSRTVLGAISVYTVPGIPFTFVHATLDRIREVLVANRGRQVFFHCASANRVGGTLIPFLILDEGIEEDDAIELATRVGLRSPELLQWVLDYTRRHQPGA